MKHFLILIIFFLSINRFADEKFPIDNLYDTKEIYPLEVKTKRWKPFVKAYRTLTGEKDPPKKSVNNKNTIVTLIPGKYKDIVSKKLGTKGFAFKNYPPFRYYDTTYEDRLKRGYISPKDLMSGYKDYKLNEIYLKGIAKKYPELVRYYELGKKTHLGNPIPAVQITRDNLIDEKPTVLFNCAHHANELISTEHCYDIMFSLLTNQEKYSSYLDNLVIWFVPIVNPDGSKFFWHKSRAMGRKNGFLFDDQSENDPNRGVDINRNYKFKWNSGHPTASSGKKEHPFYRGLRPLSEPESSAMDELFNTERFLLSMSFHSYATKVLYPYSIENTTNPKPDIAKEIAQRIVKNAISYHPTKNFEAVKNIYPVDGTDQDHFYFYYGTIALLTESSHRNIKYELVPKVMQGFTSVWEDFLNEYIDGYKLVARFVNEDDEPVSCEVKVEEILYYEGEKFTNNPRTGFYHKLFPDDNEYTLKAICPDYETEIFKFHPKKEVHVTEIVLKKK